MRSRYIHRLRTSLDRIGYPRLQMALLVSITGAAGFIASYVLLSNGVLTMWIRYLAAFGIAYLVFLGLLWLWMRTSADDYSGLGDLVPMPNGSYAPRSPVFSGKGGNFDGGGASGNYDDDGATTAFQASENSIFNDVASAAVEADEFAVPAVALLILAGLVLSSFWVIYTAPLLFAELLLDGVLATGLYKKLRTLESRHWLETAIRRTAVPFCLSAIMLAGTGLALAHVAPGAHTMSQAWLQLRTAS